MRRSSSCGPLLVDFPSLRRAGARLFINYTTAHATVLSSKFLVAILCSSSIRLGQFVAIVLQLVVLAESREEAITFLRLARHLTQLLRFGVLLRLFYYVEIAGATAAFAAVTRSDRDYFVKVGERHFPSETNIATILHSRLFKFIHLLRHCFKLLNVVVNLLE